MPDIFVQNLTSENVEDIYGWILDTTSMTGEISVWSKEENKEIILPYQEAAIAFIADRIETFRHPIEGLSVDNTLLPQLTIALEEKDEISFDYRMGREWGAKEIEALLEFLSRIKDKAPSAQILQAAEGMYEKPNNDFSQVFETYYEGRK